jgi:hypothetical protein
MQGGEEELQRTPGDGEAAAACRRLFRIGAAISESDFGAQKLSPLAHSFCFSKTCGPTTLLFRKRTARSCSNMLRCFSSFSAFVAFICFAQAASQGAPPSWVAAEVAAISRPAANPVFTASGLWSAITAWDAANPGNTFLVAGDDQASQRMLAAFLGNVAQETGGLQFNVELADGVTPCTLLTCPNYVAAGSSVGYWGRGALQVTCWGGVCGARRTATSPSTLIGRTSRATPTSSPQTRRSPGAPPLSSG